MTRALPTHDFFAAERCWPSNLFLLEMILLESASSDCANKIGFLVTGLLGLGFQVRLNGSIRIYVSVGH